MLWFRVMTSDTLTSMNANLNEKPTSAPKTARARARAELTAEILDTGRRQLAEVGADQLSLRAIAREMGMVSSAVYRYVPSREALLTSLIIDAFQSMGSAAREADANATSNLADFKTRFIATAMAIRKWALDHPHEYALIYGSPVPGYEAPADTIDPATEVPRVLLAMLDDTAQGARVANGANDAISQAPISTGLAIDLQVLRDLANSNPSDEMLFLGLQAWAQILGMISMELFGHLNNVVTDRAGFFSTAANQMADRIMTAATEQTQSRITPN